MSGECFRCGSPATQPFGRGALCDECVPETTESDAQSDTTETQGERPGTDVEDDGDAHGTNYRDIYERAADRADREAWEYVEEEALRAELEAVGFVDLLESRRLHNINGWRYTDFSDDGEDPDPRWYYASGDEPRPDEFRRFHQFLTAEAPDGYEPWYFRVEPAGKDPATRFGSWKDEDARLSVDEAVEWMEQGGNVGVAGRPDGPLVNMDIDDGEETTPDDLPRTLRARSRSRGGWHGWGFDTRGEIPNIPTEDAGEIRTNWQYVVAPGSFVASAAEEIPEDRLNDDPGYYTIEAEAPVARVEYDDLPEVFREYDAEEEDEEEVEDGPVASSGGHDDEDEGPERRERSAVFDVEAADLAPGSKDPSDRFSSIFHGSDTGANMSVSDDKLHCWRHNVAHGGLQALATLSDDCPYGCSDLGKSHDGANAGTNDLKGDWRLVWYAWREAKDQRAVPDDDPVPYRALVGVAVDDGLLDADDLVERAGQDGGGTYTGFPDAEAYNAALEHVQEEYDVDPGRDPAESATDDGEEYDDDPREVGAVVDPERAWEAERRVEYDDLDAPRDLEPAGDGVACPVCGAPTSIVRAAAVDDDLVDSCEAALDCDTYPRAYEIARERYEAPLPRYVTTSEAVAKFDTILDLIGEVGFFHLDTDTLRSDVTGEGDDVAGDAVRTLDPAWRESESGESVLVFPSGVVWDADTERTLDVLRFVALDAGMVLSPRDPLSGDRFTEAYRLAREEYGAPLPRWEPAVEGSREVTPMLPPAEEIVDEPEAVAVATDRLDAARDEVEELIREHATGEDPVVITSLPATGKTTGVVKLAAETDRPVSYLAPRKELQQQALEKADKWGASAVVLPVFSELNVKEEVLSAAVSHVRDRGKDRLRDRWAILSLVEDEVEELLKEPDEDDVDLDRATCECADGEHGAAWALVVHVARQLGYTPREIHEFGEALFGAELPCTEDGGCEYSHGWERVREAEADLLVGSYGHANVESVRTFYEDAGDGVEREARTLAYDEFPGTAHTREFGEEAHDHATWLARALSADVDDRRDLLQRTDSLRSDPFVTAWLDGEADTLNSVERAVDALAGEQKRLEAQRGADEILEEVDTDLLGAFDLLAPLERAATGAGWREVGRQLKNDDLREQVPGLHDWITESVTGPLATAEDAPDLSVAEIDLPVAGDLQGLLDRAAEAVDDEHDDAEAVIRAARRALVGGEKGCRTLAAWADHGYAHPDAHHLLAATLATADDPETARLDTDAFAFDDRATDGTRVDHVRTGERTTVVLDRNGHGALLHDPPSRTAGNGEDAPVLGLDATGRERLWSVALGEQVTTADIHDTSGERAAFLRDTLGLQVVRCSDEVRPYEGDPTTKDTDGDVALLEEIADDFTGIQAPRERGEEPVPVGKPAAVTTKGVKDLLKEDSRLEDVVAEWENYGNLTGANDLGGHRLAALLGSQHYGDDAVEKFAALAGEEADTSRTTGRGAALDYGSGVANAYLEHMREDQVMQAALRFARGESGATVFARTAALRDDLPVVGRGQVAETWSETATEIARAWRQVGEAFTRADVEDAVDVSSRQVRRVLAEFVDAGYLRRANSGPGTATAYTPEAQPGTGEVDLPTSARPDAEPGQPASNQYYTWYVRVDGVAHTPTGPPPTPSRPRGAPPAPGTAPERATTGSGPPD